jgi:hypothetical protein
MESATAFDRAPQHEPGFSNCLSVSKAGNAATASEPGTAVAERRKFGRVELLDRRVMRAVASGLA